MRSMRTASWVRRTGGRGLSRCGCALASRLCRREERRRVSVLFCDLVGFTARSERMDVEDVRGMLDTYYGKLRTDLRATAGPWRSSSVMRYGIFGAPVARGDDASEPCGRAGHVCVDRKLNSDDPSLDFHVRVGVATGRPSSH